jgi:uncharacterized membrane protein
MNVVPGVHFLWLAGMGVMSIIVIGVVLLVYFLVRGSSGPTQGMAPPGPVFPPPPPPDPSESPEDILARRFAKGEITAEEFQKARDLLRKP